MIYILIDKRIYSMMMESERAVLLNNNHKIQNQNWSEIMELHQSSLFLPITQLYSTLLSYDFNFFNVHSSCVATVSHADEDDDDDDVHFAPN